MLFIIMQKKYDENKALDAALLNEARKENMFFSKELSDIIGTTKQNSINSDMHFNAVFNKKELMLNYINISKSEMITPIRHRLLAHHYRYRLISLKGMNVKQARVKTDSIQLQKEAPEN